MALQPLIAICGTTGVGKSNLAVEIALQLATSGRKTWKSAKIINADAMQVYAGMDVITNKISISERQGVEHVLMGFKSPHEQYVVGQWVKDALSAVNNAHEKNQIPIIVGGTSYWIQHLLFPNRLAKDINTLDDGDRPLSRIFETSEEQELASSIKSLPPGLLNLFNRLPDPAPSANSDPEEAFQLYNLLKALDESVAARWHWKDTRKVLRSIRIIQETGRKPSELIHEQSQDILQPRFRTLCFWVYSKPEILKTRLDLRVDKMLKQGLLEEVRALQAFSNNADISDNEETTSDYTFGIFQSIGYKEFHRYLSSPDPTEDEFSEAVKSMKTSTRQYAKRQTSWLRNKLLPMLYAANNSRHRNGDTDPSTFTYLLDATELGKSWAANVREPAVKITNAFLDHQPLPDPLSLSKVAEEVLNIKNTEIDPSALLNARRKIICPVCTTDPTQPFMVEEDKEWELHQKSRLHRRRALKPLSAAEIEERKLQGRSKKDCEGIRVSLRSATSARDEVD
ncbi:tRNA isopentenyltransferase [Lentinula aciculospora]|uniref:tRNA isopentenyltransferase n=1 Tax=Lentinula aciculospora TaxID=153920 RepID=A0A9W9DWF4_9AGAR|nr:tRNA isopentenyltransferase [Lentinula aciculospora]